MRLLVILATILADLAVQAGLTKRGCHRINGKYYNQQILKTGISLPFMLAIDYETESLFFSYNANRTEFKSARLDLKTNKLTDIKIPQGISHAVNSEYDILFVGTLDGIYAYNIDTDEFDICGATGYIISTLFFKDDVLYFSTYPENHLYTLSNGESVKFKVLEHTKVNYFLIDDENNMFYSNDTGLYKQKIGSNQVLYESFPNFWDLRALTFDRKENIYAALRDGIYSVEKGEARVDQIVAIHDVFGVAFDSDDSIIYATDNSVVRLTPSEI